MAGGAWSTISDGTKQGIASGPIHVKPTKHKMTRPGEIPGSLSDCSTAWLALTGRLKNENQDENLEAIKTQKSKNKDVSQTMGPPRAAHITRQGGLSGNPLSNVRRSHMRDHARRKRGVWRGSARGKTKKVPCAPLCRTPSVPQTR